MALRLPEQKLWDKMRKALTSEGGIYMERVENLVNEGTPDVSMATMHLGGFWTELKAQDVLPERATSKVLGSKGLNPHQKNWHLDWRRNGGRSFILVGIEQREFLLLGGIDHDSVNDWNINQMRANALAIGWKEIADHLKGTE